MSNPSARADTATQSNFVEISTTHAHFDWTIDWKQRIITGSVTHTLEAHTDGVSEVVFDASYLDIRDASAGGKKLKVNVADRDPVMGNAVTVVLPSPMMKGANVQVKINYSTTKECTAVGWLEPEQTASKKHPFLYSQCQAIHCRSLAPMQDTPSVKLTYTALAHSHLPVLFSALRVSPSLDEPTPKIEEGTIRTWDYRQPIKVPSYLVAIAAGELVYRKMGTRTGVWADPQTVDAAYDEFATDTERFVKTAETLLVSYEWGTYDVLVLPPSFPYGGMENSNLTFLTPSLLTGDKSLVDVVAHEISHSWFGNNVGCANWGSFWLNEGWTTYTERLILRELYGEAKRGFSYIIGRKALNDALKSMEHEPRFQQLDIPYEFGEDPDLAFSTVPYDKGANFLLYLERTVGGLDVFLPYIRDYVNTFKGSVVTTESWKAHLLQYFSKDKVVSGLLKRVDWEAWLHGQGLDLPVEMEYNTADADACYDLAKKWDEAREESSLPFSQSDISNFTSNQIVVFLETLESQPALSSRLIHALTKAYSLDGSSNQEIALRWYAVALKGGQYAQEAAEWVKDKGRMKFARPTYKALLEVNPELARSTFLSNASFYHPICRALVARDLGVEIN